MIATSWDFIESFSHWSPLKNDSLVAWRSTNRLISTPPERLAGLLPQDTLEEFGVIGGEFESERLFFVVGDADQKRVEPGRLGLLLVVDDLAFGRNAVADVALGDHGQPMPARVQPHLPGLGLLPGTGHVIANVFAAFFAVKGPAVEQQPAAR